MNDTPMKTDAVIEASKAWFERNRAHDDEQGHLHGRRYRVAVAIMVMGIMVGTGAPPSRHRAHSVVALNCM